MYLTLQANFQIHLMKSNDCVPLPNILEKIYNKATIFVNKLKLTLFSPFDIKYKKLNLMKNLCKCVVSASRRVSFKYFPKVALDNVCVCMCV